VPSITLRRVLRVITGLVSTNERCSKDPGLRDFPDIAGLGARGQDIPGGGGGGAAETLSAGSSSVALTVPFVSSRTMPAESMSSRRTRHFVGSVSNNRIRVDSSIVFEARLSI